MSVRCDSSWETSVIHLTIDSLEAGTGEIESREVVVAHHASSASGVEIHRNWLAGRQAAEVHDGVRLAEERLSLYPNLAFCDSALEQLRQVKAGYPVLHQIMRKLSGFNEYCGEWRGSRFQDDRLPFLVSTESGATLAQYSRERMFRCPDGVERLFAWHARLAPSAWRIHFLPEPSNHTITVGYIGPHLSTALYA